MKRLGDLIDWRWEDKLSRETLDEMIEVVDHHAVHIAKCSWGWEPSFQHVPAMRPFDETEENNDRYSIASVQDIRDYMATGRYELVDEYGDAIGMEDFETHVCGWNEVLRKNGYSGEIGGHVGTGDSLDAYRDPEGYQFCRTCFC